MTATGHDERLMAAALRLAARGLGRTAPNPAVGCLIVRDDTDTPEIIGAGWTMQGGRPHAEAVALAQAGTRAAGATAYVTLEPCAHEGRGPACSGALIEAGVARVVCAMQDPDPRTAGQGFALLKQAGIALTREVMAAEARRFLHSHTLRVIDRRPHVLLKLAVSRDGFIAGPGGATVRITGAASAGWVHRLRAQADAILVGADTVRADDPELTCRLPGAQDRSPIRVVLDTRLETDPAARLVRGAGAVEMLFICGEDAPRERQRVLEDAGAAVIRVAVRDEMIDIAAALSALSARGVTRLMVEGGARVAASFLDAGLVDECWLFEGPGEIGAGGVAAFAGPREEIVANAGLALAERFAVGEDHVSILARPE